MKLQWTPRLRHVIKDALAAVSSEGAGARTGATATPPSFEEVARLLPGVNPEVAQAIAEGRHKMPPTGEDLERIGQEMAEAMVESLRTAKHPVDTP